MAHRNKKRSGPSFVQLYHYMLDSEGYRRLTSHARSALVEVAGLYRGDNNGRLVVPVRWLADRMSVSRNTAARALLELEEGGFIETAKLSRFDQHDRKAAEYRLTFHRCDVTHDIPSKSFMRASGQGIGKLGATGRSLSGGPRLAPLAQPTYGVDVDSVPPMGPWNLESAPDGPTHGTVEGFSRLSVPPMGPWRVHLGPSDVLAARPGAKGRVVQ